MSKNLVNFTDSNLFINKLKHKYLNFNLNKKSILFIQPYGSSISLLKRGIENGFNIIILTSQLNFCTVTSEIIDNVKLAIKVNTANDWEVLQLVKILNNYISIHAVIPGFEYFVPIASKLSHQLGVPGIEIEDVTKLRRKDFMRLELQEKGIIAPKFYIVNSVVELEKAIRLIGFPAVCKPVDAAGSVNVKRVSKHSEAFTAGLRILEGEDVLWGHKLTNILLFEEYIEGNEFSLEGIVQNGKIIFFSVTEKFVSDQLEFVEVGHVVNTPIASDLKQCAEAFVEKVIQILNVNNCPFHAKIKINHVGQPILMEIAAQLAGDNIGDLINLARNINYFDYIFATYLGEEISMPSMDDSHAGIRFFYRPHISEYKSVYGIEEARKRPIEEINLYYKPHEPIPSFPKPLRRLGHAIARSDNYFHLLKLLNEVDANIIFYS